MTTTYPQLKPPKPRVVFFTFILPKSAIFTLSANNNLTINKNCFILLVIKLTDR